MNINPEQYPGFSRFELGPAGGRISELQAAMQIADKYEKMHPATDDEKPVEQKRPAYFLSRSTPVKQASAPPEKEVPKHLRDARSQVNEALKRVA